MDQTILKGFYVGFLDSSPPPPPRGTCKFNMPWGIVLMYSVKYHLCIFFETSVNKHIITKLNFYVSKALIMKKVPNNVYV